MELPGDTKSNINKDKTSQNVLHPEITEVVLIKILFQLTILR